MYNNVYSVCDEREDNMRVITGSARGMVLRTLEGESVRPTTDKVKEAVFSAIQFEIEGRRGDGRRRRGIGGGGRVHARTCDVGP